MAAKRRTSFQLDLETLDQLRLPDHVADILRAGFPKPDDFRHLTPTKHRRAVEDLTAIALPLLQGTVTAEDLVSGSNADPDEVWEITLLVLAAWWSTVLVAAERSHRKLHPGISWAKMTELLEGIRDHLNGPAHVQGAQQLFVHFGMFLIYADLVDLFQGRPAPAPESLERTVHHMLHDALARLWAIRRIPRLTRAADYVVEQAIGLLPEVYERDPGGDDNLHGPFAAINLTDFLRLARRDERILKKYGQGTMSRVFEHQLALIIQSLGALVIQTRPGERTVDLYCLSTDATAPFAFLIEAKTSKRAYGLPSSDQRALAEYVQQTKRLRTLPRLRFVLIVADRAAATLPVRLRQLESTIAIPVRFLSAKGLAHLRAALVGPNAFDRMGELIVGGPSCLPDEFGDQVVGIINREQEAHENLVRTVLGLDG